NTRMSCVLPLAQALTWPVVWRGRGGWNIVRRRMVPWLKLDATMAPAFPHHLFPPFPERKDFDLFAAMLPAREVGGDFYDFFLIDNDRLGFVIGDVSGKGVPAAIFMAMSRTLLKATALAGARPAECLQRANRVLCLDNSSEMFVTVFYGIFDTRTGAIEYGNGGHNPPYLLRANGEVEALESTGGMVLGALEDVAYRSKTVVLRPGDGI